MARSRSSGTAFDDRGLALPRPQCDGPAMTADGSPVDDAPSRDEIRATVDCMIVSEAFGRSPQLGAFLRFVVEAVLQGKSDRIKGYTIGVEVLRRDVSFDPQSECGSRRPGCAARWSATTPVRARTTGSSSICRAAPTCRRSGAGSRSAAPLDCWRGCVRTWTGCRGACCWSRRSASSSSARSALRC
jgi:hypothetical protein